MSLQHEATTTSSPHLEENDQIKVEEAGQVKLPEEGQDYSKGVDEDEQVDESPQFELCENDFPQTHEAVQDPFWEFIISNKDFNSHFYLKELTTTTTSHFKSKPISLKFMIKYPRKTLHHEYHRCLMVHERKMFSKSGK